MKVVTQGFRQFYKELLAKVQYNRRAWRPYTMKEIESIAYSAYLKGVEHGKSEE